MEIPVNVDPSVDSKAARAKMEQAGAPLAALKWVLKNPNVDAAIRSIRDFEQLEENLRDLREPLNVGDGKLPAGVWERNRGLYCRMCGACSGAYPRGVPVQDALRFFNCADGYGEIPLARQEWLSLPSAAREISSSDCGRCAVRCANWLNVQARARRAQDLFA